MLSAAGRGLFVRATPPRSVSAFATRQVQIAEASPEASDALPRVGAPDSVSVYSSSPPDVLLELVLLRNEYARESNKSQGPANVNPKA